MPSDSQVFSGSKRRNTLVRSSGPGSWIAVRRGIVGTMLCVTFRICGQDALRVSTSHQDAGRERRRAIENAPYTFQLQQARFLAFGRAGIEWNDNINISHDEPLTDVILRPEATLQMFWPITDLNALSFSLDFGYEKFVEHSQYDDWLIRPGSQLSWDLFVQSVRINFHDHFSYEQDPTSAGAASGTARYGGFYNTAGVMAIWDLNPVAISFGYDHFLFDASSEAFTYLNRHSHFGFLRGEWEFYPGAIVGLETAGGPTSYSREILADNISFSLGAFNRWQATDHIRLSARGGFYQYYFDQGGVTRTEDQAGYYASVTLDHELRRGLSYTLDGGREAYMGNLSSLTEEWHGAAYINWRAREELPLSFGLRYEMASRPADEGTDDYDRFSAFLRLSYQIREKWTVRAEYRHWVKTSENTESLNYGQNRVTLQTTYRF